MIHFVAMAAYCVQPGQVYPDLPVLEDPSQRSASVDFCRAAQLRGSPHQVTLSRISQLEI